MPYFICPNCRRRSIDHDRLEDLTNEAVGCAHCGFGFLFELLDDYYPAPGTGFVVCDRNRRILALGQGVFELTGFRERDVIGLDVKKAFSLEADGVFPSELIDTLLDQLRAVLTYHVVAGQVTAAALLQQIQAGGLGLGGSLLTPLPGDAAKLAEPPGGLIVARCHQDRVVPTARSPSCAFSSDEIACWSCSFDRLGARSAWPSMSSPSPEVSCSSRSRASASTIAPRTREGSRTQRSRNGSCYHGVLSSTTFKTSI